MPPSIDSARELSEFFKNYGSTIAICIAVIGWFVTSGQADKREKRKEFRAEIDAIEKVLDGLMTKLAEYYRLAERNDAAKLLELEIKAIYRSVDLRCERLRKRQKGGELGLLILPINALREELFDLGTGDYFESSNRMPQDKVSEFALSLRYKAMALVEALHALHLKKYDGI